MEFSSAFTFRQAPQQVQQEGPASTHDNTIPLQSAGIHCPHFAGFIAVAFAEGHNTIGLHPVISNTSPSFQDVSLGGGSFEVRKVKVSSFPTGLGGNILQNREYVAVKHPRTQNDNTVSFADISLELQILRHPPVQKHENIVDLLAVMYHDTRNENGVRVLPALVLECAEYGSLKAYQEAGYACTLEEKLNIAHDTARGLEGLHDAGLVHGDIKPSNLLVFKHPTRKVIVKLSDFGFAMPIRGGQLIGSTEVYRAPEAEGVLSESRYLRQQDIYSFGLTLCTIINDGVPFHASIPEDGKLENVLKLKKSNLMPSLAALRALDCLRNESYPIMTLIKVIVTCLQCSPERRFSNMSKIINHLEITQSIVKSRNGLDTPDAEGLRDAFTTLQKVGYGAQVPASDDERNHRVMLTGLATLALASLSQQLGGSLSQMNLNLEEIPNLLTQFLPMAHQRFYSSFNEDEMPMKNALERESKERLQTTIQVLLAGAVTLNGSGETRPVSAINACQIILDCAGFLVEPTNSQLLTSVNNVSNLTPLRMFQGEEFIPDITKSSNILQKTPKPVRVALFESLKNIFTTSTVQAERSKAAIQLASGCIEDIGVEYDLKLAAHYILQAAHLGSEKARTLYITTFSHVPGMETPDQETLRTWTLESAHTGCPAAFQKLKDFWPLDYERVVQSVLEGELICLGLSSSAFEEVSSMLQSLSLSDAEGSQAQDLFLWSIVMNKPEVTASCLDQNHGLIDIVLQYAETPLLLAARLGHKQVLQKILEHPSCGSAAEIADERGVTSLHWLCSFYDEDHEAVATLLFSKGADLNAPACAISYTQYGVKFKEDNLMIQTPMHWAITQNRLSAVDILIKLGADPNFCMEAMEREAANLSPLELACGLCYSCIVSRLLQEPSVSDQANTPKPMLGGGELMYLPLFHVIRGDPRWQRLSLGGINFESESKKTMEFLIANGAPTDAVLQVGDVKMAAVFATAYHQCSADLMVSGLELGFANQIEARFGNMSSGGTALFLAITHQDRAMFKALLDAGADVNALDADGLSPLHRAAKETDDAYFIQALLEKGLPVDPSDAGAMSAFEVAVFIGNLTIARYLYDQGADRDRVPKASKKSIMAEMVSTNTRNALHRVKFLLSLPDRDGSDGFMVRTGENEEFSLLHYAITYVSEFPEDNEIMSIMIVEILRKYHTSDQIDNTAGPHQMTPLAQAAEAGNYFVVRRLLEAGANPNIPDQFGRKALDLVYKRWCLPEKLPALEQADHSDEQLIAKILKAVNENTTEVKALLDSYGAEFGTWTPPAWFENGQESRNLSWVLERLRENSSSV